MEYARVGLRYVAILSLLAFWSASAPRGSANPADVTGRYQCVQEKMGGKILPCKAPSLNLKADGRFELSGWEGSYLVNGHWVELSGELLKSRAKIEPGHKIVFRYYGKRGWIELTYERRVVELGKTSLS